MATAQAVYKAFARDELSPRLRALGFKGSGGGYELPSSSHWIVLGIQASAFSSRDEVKVTVNCQVVGRELWEALRRERPYLGQKPKANTVAGGLVWWSRIGTLMPGGEDRWWFIRRSGEATAVAEKVADAVSEYALPAMRQATGGGDAA